MVKKLFSKHQEFGPGRQCVALANCALHNLELKRAHSCSDQQGRVSGILSRLVPLFCEILDTHTICLVKIMLS